MSFEPLINELEEEYIWRICQSKELNGELLNWNTVAELVNKYYHEFDPKGESAYRKPYQGALKYWNVVFSKMKNLQLDDEKLIELKKEIVKFRDMRNAFEKRIRESAREEEKWELLEEKFSEIGKNTFIYPEHENVDCETSENSIIVCLSDLHIGLEFDSYDGKFNSDIARERLLKYRNAILDRAKKENCKNCYIALLGDLISGNIHETIAIANKENVIEQLEVAAELISEFIYGLMNDFDSIMVKSVSGNHSRISSKDKALYDERLDRVIEMTLSAMFKHVSKVNVDKTRIDSSLNYFSISGKKYLLAHGDYDNFSPSGIGRLISKLKEAPHALLMGHKHYCRYDEISGVKVIQSGCLSGSGDDYTNSKRLTGKPSQCFMTVDEKGINGYYAIEL